MNLPTNCHAIMFHHFHDGKIFKKTQGSLDSKSFEKKIKKLIKLKYKLICPQEWIKKLINRKLLKNELCLTFDDGLLCQYKIALPILNKYNIKAFWFVFTGPLENESCELEIFRKFRIECFKNINSFYNFFFNYLKKIEKKKNILKLLQKKNFGFHLKEHKFYSNLDRKFRYFRDKVYGEKNYNKIMYELILKKKIKLEKLNNNLWINKKQIQKLSIEGHEFGLHSYSHNTILGNTSYQNQLFEYKKNLKDIKSIINKKITSCAYPSNSFNKNTIKILKSLNILISFRSDHNFKKNSDYQLKRIDHTLL